MKHTLSPVKASNRLVIVGTINVLKVTVASGIIAPCIRMLQLPDDVRTVRNNDYAPVSPQRRK